MIAEIKSILSRDRFNTYHIEEIWRHHLRSLFKTHKITRSHVASSLKKMRSFRNRIAHHEPIISFSIQDYEQTAFELIGMSSMISLDWLKHDLLEERT